MAAVTSKRQWTGLERQLLVKLRNSLDSIVNRDSRMLTRANTTGVSAYYFVVADGDATDLAIQTLYTRITDCLNAKT